MLHLNLQETHSAVILACTANGDLRAARAAYDAARSQGICPSIQACNSLMALYARGGRLGEVVTLLADMMRAGLQPDTVTYAAMLSTCQRADAAELAFEVVRVMKERGIRMQESHCFVLLRLCYNRCVVVLELWLQRPCDFGFLQKSIPRGTHTCCVCMWDQMRLC